MNLCMNIFHIKLRLRVLCILQYAPRHLWRVQWHNDEIDVCDVEVVAVYNYKTVRQHITSPRTMYNNKR